jgi:predicted RNA binding protein YcfA (HicA-like mRNA interferase family)
LKLPRDLSGADLIRGLRRLGYGPTRQTGSHVRLSCTQPKEHHLTVPLHDPLRVGTLAAVVAEVASAHGLTREDVIEAITR